MLCEIYVWGNFLQTWLILSIMAFASIMIMSGAVFHYLYQHPTYDMWRYKSNPRFPTVIMVRNEILQTAKGTFSAALCPAISLYLSSVGYSQGYCGLGTEQFSTSSVAIGYLVFSFLFTVIVSDFVEFYYHRLGHTTSIGWEQHRPHHKFYNPTPFAVIADEPVDQFMRALPLVLFPMLMPINIDMLFFEYIGFFYLYGIYLHCGYEVEYPDAHHPIMNTSFQHLCHHAKSTNRLPYHTGFFLKIWDNLFDSVYTDKCFCAKCSQNEGLRGRAQWEDAISKKPDYKALLNPSIWFAKEN